MANLFDSGKRDHFCTLLGTTHPIVQAPMANAQDHEMAIAVSNAGGLGSLPCSTLDSSEVIRRTKLIRAQSSGPLNLNFFCHVHSPRNAQRDQAWIDALRPHYEHYGVTATPGGAVAVRTFAEEGCSLVEELKPEVVSFHFGLPSEDLIHRVKATGAKILSSATTVEEAIYLEHRGCDAIIAQGLEAGGHRGHFLEPDHTTQLGTFALLPQVAKSVNVPIIAAGGVSDPQTMAAAFVLGAAGVQVGTAFLKTPEAIISDTHRALLSSANAPPTLLTNVFTGRQARSFNNKVISEVGPMSSAVPDFPYALPALAPLKSATESSGDYASLWSGQSSALAPAMSSSELTKYLSKESARLLNQNS